MKRSKHNLYLVGNWKMNPTTLVEAEGLAKSFMPLFKKIENTTLWLAVPNLFVYPLVKQVKGTIVIGVQNIHHESSGAFTGDVSGAQAKSSGACFTIIGHSERRALGEDDNLCNKKITSALANKLEVILCVGEAVRDEHGDYLELIKAQVKNALVGVTAKDLKNITIAYEPVWAIGKNATGIATPHESLEVSILIRRTLSDLYGDTLAKKIIIIYGGSANSENALGFLADGGVQGFLLGRASLDKEELRKISLLNK